LIDPIYFRQSGEGTPIILIHGDFANGALAWSQQIDALGKHHRMIVVDRRGNGNSPREPRPYTIAWDAVDVLEVADLTNAATFHLLGHSYGGLVAFEIARRAPDRVLSLHMIEPPYLALVESIPDLAPVVQRTRDLFATASTRDPEETTVAFFSLLAGSEGMARLRERPAWATLVAESTRIGQAQFPGDYPIDALHDLRPGFPVRVYTGGRSHPIGRHVAVRLVESIAGAKLVEIPEAFHDVQRAGEAFNRELLSVTSPT
jgi:pimeloyl-ACP methyl ester carboxylesterase